MQSMDSFSYTCGAIDCLNELICAGVKALAQSHPMDTAAARDALLPFAEESCRRWGTRCYIEDAPLLTDLFPTTLQAGKFSLLFYREDHILEQYLRLKEHKSALVAQGAYFGGNRSQVAGEYGRLLSYGSDAIRRLIAENLEREEV